MKEDILILVDDNDEEVGYAGKQETHRMGLLHRAFSVFIYNAYDKTLLLHKRAMNKYHSGGLWTNSCCSHPRRGETLDQAVNRRIYEELGVSLNEVELQYGVPIELGKFKYFQSFGSCSEYEIDHVYCVIIKQEEIVLHYDVNEIEAVKWITFEELDKWFSSSPQDFTAWFEEAYLLFRRQGEKFYV